MRRADAGLPGRLRLERICRGDALYPPQGTPTPTTLPPSFETANERRAHLQHGCYFTAKLSSASIIGQIEQVFNELVQTRSEDRLYQLRRGTRRPVTLLDWLDRRYLLSSRAELGRRLPRQPCRVIKILHLAHFEPHWVEKRRRGPGKPPGLGLPLLASMNIRN